MTIREIKLAKERINVSYDSNLGIQTFGDKNLYPQDVKQLLASSPTASGCMDRYATFIEGNGFNDVAFSSFVCNRRGDTIDEILHLVCEDMARYHGFALHVNYNMMCRVTSMVYIPFECCRLEEETEDGQVMRIAYHPDWKGKKTRKGHKLIPSMKSVKWFWRFNPNRDVVMAQIEAAGGIENYSGQILWFSFDGKNRYPTPICDKVLTCMSTDEGLDNVKYRNVRNNFLPSGMWITKKGSNLSIDGDNGDIEEAMSRRKEEVTKTLEVFMGDENTGSIMQVEVEDQESMPEWKAIEAMNFDKKFSVTTQDTEERIYSAFGQEPFYCIRKGKTGFSGDVLSDAYDYYNSYVSRQRRCITRQFKTICSCWDFNINLSNDYDIQPMVLVRQNTSSEL